VPAWVRLVDVDRRQYTIIAVIGLLAAFIGGGIALLATDDDKQSIRADGTTTSSSSTLPTSTVPPTTPATAPPATAAPPVPPQTVTPGTAVTVPTTRPATTTTHAAPTTTTTHPRGGSDIGISGDEIRLAVIADDPATFEGMTAWMTAVNKHGGIADRDVRLDLLETGGSADGYAAAVTTACDTDFAIVGSFSIFDVAPGAVDCAAIPDLPVEASSTDHGAATNTYSAFPRSSITEAVGPYRWLLDNVDGCCTPFTLLPDTEPGRTRTASAIAAAQAAGFDSGETAEVSASDDPDRYTELVGEIEDSNATFAASGLGLESTVLLRQAAAGGAADVHAWYCDTSCYDGAFLANGGNAVEDEFLGIETVPFTDKDEVAALRTYLRTTRRAAELPSYAGLRAYVTGLLFEASAKAVVEQSGEDGLTRVRLLDTLSGVHDFDAGGIVGPTDVGRRTPTGCYVLLQVHDGKFTRVNPAEKGRLDCASDNLVTIGP
jgi:hypothetical protein